MSIEQRIEAVRAFFELADNWPIEPFPLPGSYAWVFEPGQFVDGHLDIVLSGKDAGLILPYLERLEGVIGMIENKKQPISQEPTTSNQ